MPILVYVRELRACVTFDPVPWTVEAGEENPARTVAPLPHGWELTMTSESDHPTTAYPAAAFPSGRSEAEGANASGEAVSGSRASHRVAERAGEDGAVDGRPMANGAQNGRSVRDGAATDRVVAERPVDDRAADETAVNGYRGEPAAAGRADETVVDGRRARRDGYGAAPAAVEPVAEEPVVKRGGAAATAALVFGIFALVTSFTVVGGVVLGILALIFGVIGSRRAKRGLAYGRGRALAGILTGLIGIIISIALIGFFVSMVRGSDAKAMRNCVQHAGFNASAIHSCYKEYHH